jgi:hypothetical protein
MNPQSITKILDLAKRARKKGLVLNPLFAGDAGLGKSFICQQWAEKQKETNPKFGFIDLRPAFYEGPDLIGFPEIREDAHGRPRTYHNLPAFWPTEGEGLLLIEEVNRANPSTMNCLMQLLTDRKIGDYTLPEGWIIAGCINDGSGYDVNGMDTALTNRFEVYDIIYDSKAHLEFLNYAKESNWHPSVIAFLNSGMWTYVKSESVGEKDKYISPRTLNKLNNIEQSGAQDDRELHFNAVAAILGSNVGKAYHTFVFEQRPVLVEELIKTPEEGLARLKQQSDPGIYRGDLIDVTIKSMIDHMTKELETNPSLKEFTFPESTLLKVALIIPTDQSISLLEQYVVTHPDPNYNLAPLVEKCPELREVIRATKNRLVAEDVPETEKKGKKKK